MLFDTVWLDLRLATLAADRPGIGIVEHGAVAAKDGRVAFAGPAAEMPAGWDAVERHRMDGRWATPGLIDCHTHLVHAGDRAQEFEMRLAGASYEEIARAGGGILSTVKATRAASDDQLVAAALPRLDALIAEGVTTIEVKSGYGLEQETEARMLRAARRLERERDVGVVTSFLGAHAMPPEAAGDKKRYIDDVCAMIPAFVSDGLCDAVDAFCERIAFSADEVARVFKAAHAAGLPVRLHADQLSNTGGAKLAARHRALSADHLEYTDEEGVAAMAHAGTVAVLLPGAFYVLREKQAPPVEALRRHRVPIAIATDMNPGTSPVMSLLLIMNMAATLFRLTVEETIAGVTREAARALGRLDEIGTLESGKWCDLAIWNIERPAEARLSHGLQPAACARSEGAMAPNVTLVPGKATLGCWRAIADGAAVRLDPAAIPAVEASALAIEAIVASGKPVYGINTGFGRLAGVHIPAGDLAALQRNLVLSHAAGVGEPMPSPRVRLMMALKLASLGRGASGVRPAVLALLEAMLARDVIPVIPSQGSAGASGDLAPLAHLAAAMLGVGEAWHDGARLPAADALSRAGLAAAVFGPKEGLALLNGTQFSTAEALASLFAIERVFQAALVTGALSTDAAKGSDTPFDARIHALRGHRGQIDVAAALRALMAGSTIRASHLVRDDRVQDPYCLRCQPQVMGAALDLIRHAAATLIIEANAVSDNPLIFAADNEALSGGNFHAEPIAFAADILAIALCEIGSLAERRVAMLIDPSLSRLPAFLTPQPGLNSGFMIAQVTAAALVSENKQRAYPASVDSIPTSANQEDHVSMAAHGARRLAPMTENAVHVVAIEALTAAQGCDFHAPMLSSGPLERVRAIIRASVPALDHDRLLAPEIAAAAEMVRSGALAAAAAVHMPGLEG